MKTEIAFTNRPLSLRGKSPQGSLGTRLGGPQIQSRNCAEKNFLLDLGTEPRFLSCPALSPVAIPTEISHLHYNLGLQGFSKCVYVNCSLIVHYDRQHKSQLIPYYVVKYSILKITEDVPPKRCKVSTKLHGATFQKTVILTPTNARTSDVV
jgi:hypothetical protein